MIRYDSGYMPSAPFQALLEKSREAQADLVSGNRQGTALSNRYLVAACRRHFAQARRISLAQDCKSGLLKKIGKSSRRCAGPAAVSQMVAKGTDLSSVPDGAKGRNGIDKRWCYFLIGSILREQAPPARLRQAQEPASRNRARAPPTLPAECSTCHHKTEEHLRTGHKKTGQQPGFLFAEQLPLT